MISASRDRSLGLLNEVAPLPNALYTLLWLLVSFKNQSRYPCTHDLTIADLPSFSLSCFRLYQLLNPIVLAPSTRSLPLTRMKCSQMFVPFLSLSCYLITWRTKSSSPCAIPRVIAAIKYYLYHSISHSTQSSCPCIHDLKIVIIKSEMPSFTLSCVRSLGMFNLVALAPVHCPSQE